MKSDVVQVDNMEHGYREAREQTVKSAIFRGLDRQNILHLQLLTEEMLSMVHSIAGELKAFFWVESEGNTFDLHLTSEIVMDRETRQMLIDASTSKKNEAAGSFLGKLRNVFEEARVSNTERTYFELPLDVQVDVTGREIQGTEWDRFEQSVLHRMANGVKIFIRGKDVHMVVTKVFF